MNDDSDSAMSTPPATPPRRGADEGSEAGASATFFSPAVPPTPHEAPLTPLSDVEDPSDDNARNEPPRLPIPEDRPAMDQDVARVRGTNVHVPAVAATFTDFLRTFQSLEISQQRNRQNREAGDDESIDSSIGELPPLYLARLQLILENQDQMPTVSLDIDTMHIYFHNEQCQKLYGQLVAYPMELVPLMDILVQRELELLAEQQGTQATVRIQVRPYNLKDVSILRELDPVAMDSLVCVKGMVVRTSPIIPDLKVAHFSCAVCGDNVQVNIDRGRIQEPQRCDQCGIRMSYQMIHNRCIFADKQMVRLQETPDEVPAGQTPASVISFAFDDLVDSIQPGDKVEVTGVLRAQPVRVNPKISKVKAVYKTYLDVIHFRKITLMNTQQRNANLTQQGGKAHWTPERIAQLRELSQHPDIYDKLTQSLAPSIWELDNIKKGVLCMLFGGNHVRVRRRSRHEEERDWLDQDDDDAPQADHSKLHKRGDINILLCGDPGTSKSQLLSYVNKLSTRGVYTSGKGSSAVGLTASVVRDPETRDLVLESGALVLSDLGICCIDEFDKMSDTTRSVLHEAMEQQTVSIAKAGIIATLHARTSVLASANPVESRYNPNRSVVDNIQLPPTLLSRFDLIYLVLDSPNVDSDRRLAQHLVGLYYETPNVVQPPLDQALLRDYIEYARENIHPEISLEASEQLIASYLEMRNPGGVSSGRTITATPRQLESLIRLSEALAKMRYGNVVTRADACEAVRLMKVATQAAATDPRTGRIDMDMITTGRSTADRELEEQIDITLRELFAEKRGSRLAVRDVSRQLAEITNSEINHDEVVRILRQMEADGIIQFNERAQSLFVRTGIHR